MRIGFFSYGIYGDRMTGIARYAVELSRALTRLEPDLEIILLSPYPESTHSWYREFPVYPLPHLKKLPLAATLGNLELHQAATRLKLDVLHDPCGIAPFFAPRREYRKITTVHDCLPAIYPATQPFLTRLIFSVLVSRAARTCDAIVTVSQTSADDLMRYYKFPPEMIHAIPNGTNRPALITPEELAAIRGQYNVNPPYFLYVGALHPRKNIRRVIEAFKQVRSNHPETSLVIVGPPSWGADQELQAVLGSAADGSGIVFTDFLSDDHLNALYQGAHGLVFPSLYEGFGLPVIEAMSHGTPVITSNISALPEVAGDAALLVDPTSVAEIAQSMSRLLESADLHSVLRQKGFIRSEEFSWEATARKTLEVYRKTVT